MAARTLLLHDEHRDRGATFAESAGAELVASYGDAVAEARQARAFAVLADRSQRGRLAVTGADRVGFLSGQATGDVAALDAGEGLYTAFLTGKGKMRGDAVVHAQAERLLLRTEGEALALLRSHLESFVIMEDVAISDESAATVELAVFGRAAREALAAAGIALDCNLPAHHFVLRAIDGAEVLIAADPGSGEDGFTLIAPAAAGAALFRRLAEKVPPAGNEALEALRIEAGIPRFGQDMDAESIPLEAAVHHAVSYSKGCFTGQEVMARIKNYGHVNRELVGLLLRGTEPAPVGARVEDAGKPVGLVTSSVLAPSLNRPIALATVRREAAAPGHALEVVSGTERVAAEVSVLPFVRRER